LTDESIVELYWNRSEQAIEETSRKYSKYCGTIAFNILRDIEDADECVNDTFLGAWNAIPSARPNRLSTFLGKITRNLSFNKFKLKNAKKRGDGMVDVVLSELEECIPSAISVEQEVEGNILSKVIDDFLGATQKQHRDVFVCRYWYSNTVSEIAADYGLSESNVKAILFRTRNKLKKHLQEAGVLL
jgi:RNA polymerase sigma-70 factor (ECF subfamily)